MNYINLNKYEGSTTKINIKDKVPFITFHCLEKYKWLRHGFSTRIGGVSTDYLSTMNLGFGRGDDETNVVKNHEIMSKAIGFDSHNIVCSHQTHTTNIRIVDKNDCGKGIYIPKDYENIDGLITNKKNIVLATYFADCVPLFIVDINKQVVGLAHSGWKGTVKKIGKETIKLMTERFGTDPDDVICCVGPSICQKCYQIGEDVAVEFKNNFPDHIEDILLYTGGAKYQLDLWKANKLVLLEAGVNSNNIFTTDICTCCNPEVLFSHRGHKGKRGNMAAFLTLN